MPVVPHPLQAVLLVPIKYNLRGSRVSARKQAHGDTCIPLTGCGGGAGGAICRARGHCLLFCGAKIRFLFDVQYLGSLTNGHKSQIKELNWVIHYSPRDLGIQALNDDI